MCPDPCKAFALSVPQDPISAMTSYNRNLTQNNDLAGSGLFQLINNTWNIGSLVNGIDFEQRISFNNAAFTTSATTGLLRNVEFAWDFGLNPEGSVRTYPEVIVGATPWNETGSTALTSRVTALNNLDVTFDLETTTGVVSPGSNIAFDIWLTNAAASEPQHITTELMVWLSSDGISPAGTVVSRYEAGAFSGNIHVQDNFSATEGVNWRYIAVSLDTPTFSGTLDLDGLLRHLVREDLVARNDYFIGYELGAEVVAGPGGFTVTSLTQDAEFFDVTSGDDLLFAGRQDDVIDGRGGNDKIRGGGGHDRLYGHTGDDLLFGDHGSDFIKGQDGDDKLLGGYGQDVLIGGDGADHFVFTAPGEIGGTAKNSRMDRIADFNSGEGDRISLYRMDADWRTAGNQEFTWRGTEGFTGNGGELRTTTSGNKTLVLGDSNGDGTADFTLELTGLITLDASDFLL